MTSAAPHVLHQLQDGGTLSLEHRYIPRQADGELREALLAGEFCYVLAPRQIGKSSLRVRVQRELEAQGVRVATLSLDQMGAGASSDQWYYALVDELSRQLALDDEPDDFWEAAQQLAPVQRWSRYLRERVLAITAPSPVVVFIDEIDTVLRLTFGCDDFFAAVRAVYNDRADYPDYHRLTFCLLGVAAPADLIADPVRTPFNIGRRIVLRDFTREETHGFKEDLTALDADPIGLLEEIYAWAAGHPYMTQHLCVELHRRKARGLSLDVRNAVEELFLRRGRREDPNLSYAERRLDGHQDPRPLLSLYRRLLQEPDQMALVEDEERARLHLHLCGFVAERELPEGGCVLTIRNRIFAQVFGSGWVKEKLGERRLGEAVERWRASGRSRGALLRGLELEEVNAWAKAHPQELMAEENEFLRACLEAALAEEEQRRLAMEKGLADERRRAAQAVLHTERSLRASLLAERPERVMEALFVGMQAVYEDPLGLTFEALAWEGLVSAAVAARIARPLEGHTAPVSSVAFSPDGSRIVTASSDGTARLWESASGRLLFWLGAKVPPVGAAARGINTAAFSPDGRAVLTAGDDGTAQLWEVAMRGALLVTLAGHAGPVLCAVFSPDGQRIATSSGDGTARLWTTRDGATLRTLEGHEDRVHAVALSPDGERVVTASADGTVRVREEASGRPLHTLEGHTGTIYSVRFSPDGRQVVTASADGTARLWDAHSARFLASLQGHQGPVFSARFSPDGRQVVTAGADGLVRLWDARSGRLSTSFQAHAGGALDAAFSPDGEVVASVGADRTVRLWDLQRSQILRRLVEPSGPVLAAAFSPDGQRVVTSRAEGTARLWDAESGRELRVLEGHAGMVHGVGTSPAGDTLLTAGPDGTVRLWELQGGRQLLYLEGHVGPVHAACLAPDGATVLTAGADRTARLWDARSGQQLEVLLDVPGRIVAAAFLPEGPRVVTASSNGIVQLWEVPSGTLREELAVRQESSESLRVAALAPNGRILATTSSLGVTRLWQVPEGKLLLSLRGHTEVVHSIAFSPDGRHIVTASDDGTAVIHPVRHEDYYAFACRVLRSWREVPGVSDEALLEKLLGACPDAA